MRARDLRDLQREHNKERWRELWAPANDEATDDPEGDEAWRDAIAEANSGTEELNRRDE